MRRITLTMSAAAMLCAFNANAETYFFSPDGAGDQDGSSWENAAPGEYLGSTLDGLQEGDEVYMMAGNYRPDINMGYWNIPANGVKVCGGYPATMTGTDTTMPAWEGYSVWDADIDGDGNPDNGDDPFVYMGTGYLYQHDRENEPLPGQAALLDLPLTVLSGVKICNASAANQYHGVAILVRHANVELGHILVENCHITPDSENAIKKGGIVVVHGGKSYIHDFIMRKCTSFGAGMGIQYRQYNNGSTAADVENGGFHILERAELSDVDAYLHPTKNNKDGANYGGAISIADGGGTLIMVNSTVSGSHIWVAGGGIRVGGNASFYNINNTWYDCTTDYANRAQGKILSVGTAGKFYTANSIVVNKAADELNGKDLFNFAMIQIQTNTCTFATGGYNVFGSISNNTTTSFASTDITGEANTEETVFGTNARTEIDGFNVREPKASYAVTPIADITKLKSEWELPDCIDLSVDIRGKKRANTTYPGAYDPNATAITSHITDFETESEIKVVSLGDGRYQIEGSDETAQVYDLNGRLVSKGARTLDLNSTAKGVYIIRVAGHAQKIVK